MPKITNKSLQSERRRLDKIAQTFSMGESLNKKLEKYKLIKMRLDVKDGEVLEVGCADGFLTKGLAEHYKHITAIDASEKLLKKAKRLRLKNAEFVHTLFEEYEPKKQFDTIILAEILEHVINPVLLLKLSRRWLKDTGRVIIISPNAKSLHRQIGVFASMLKDIHDLNETDIRVGHRRVYDHKSMTKDIRLAKLKIVKSDGIFLKPLANIQMDTLDDKVLDAFFEIGEKTSPEWLAQLYFVCKK